MADFWKVSLLTETLGTDVLLLMGGGHTLVVVDHIPEVILAGVVSFPYTHGVVGEVHIAVVTLDG